MKETSVSSISGGRTSLYMALFYPTQLHVFSLVSIVSKDSLPKDKSLIDYIEQKTGKELTGTAESVKTLQLMREFEQLLGSNIIWLTKRTYDSLFVEKHVIGGIPSRLPSWARRYCTLELKIIPIFEELYFRHASSLDHIFNTNIGFRYDERHRAEQMQLSNPNSLKYPTSTKVYGKHYQNWEMIEYRKVLFPLIQDKISQPEIIKFWSNKNLIFPEQSNCVGCFHKDEISINLQAKAEPDIFRWFKNAENLGLGTWNESGLTYERIEKMQFTIPLDFGAAAVSCSGGCTD